MIILNWKPQEALGVTYYYTFYKEMILCVKAENVVDGVIKDEDFVFPVTVNNMDPDTGRWMLTQMIHLFPELTLDQLKTALEYDFPPAN
jgi:hypothetical protein